MNSLWKIALAALAAWLYGTSAGSAQDYPVKPVRVIVPYVAGGSTDTTARQVARALSESLGQPFIVEDHAGAGGLVGQDMVAKAAPDGYTLLFSAAGPLTVTPHTYAKLPYDPIGAFVPIKLIATAPLLLVVNPKLPVTSLRDLVKLAAAQPRKMTYASFGYGSAAHLAGELFKMLAHIDITHIPYNGSPPALADVIAGRVDMMFDVLVSGLPQARAGTVRALAITSRTRSPLAPDIPTMEEAGVKGFEAGTWFGLLGRAGTSPHIISTLSQVLDTALARPDFRRLVGSQGAVVAGGTPEQFDQFFLAEYEKWGKIVKAAGIKAE